MISRALSAFWDDVQSAQFEATAELIPVRQAHAEALRLDDRERVYKARGFALLETTQDEAARLALTLFLRADDFDRRERAAIEQRAVPHLDRATRFLRAATGRFDAAMERIKRRLAGKVEAVS